ncbi:MAG: hypothetical protein ACUZ8O_02570 [Candidatus Anammoxibacter sp.]
MYTANSCSSNVSVIDGVTNEVIATIMVEDSQMGESLKEISVNPATNRIYVVNSASNNVSVIDGSTNDVITTIVVDGSIGGIGVNSTTNRIYVTRFLSNQSRFVSTRHVIVIDGSTNEVVDIIELEDGAGRVSVNSITNRIYVASGSNVSAIDGLTDKVIATIDVGERLGFVVSGVRVNPVTNQIYVSSSTINSFPTVNLISVIDGSTNDVIDTVDLGSSSNGFFGILPGRVGINPTTNHIYVIEEGHTDIDTESCPEIMIRVSGDIKVIDGLINQLIVTDNLGFDMHSSEKIGIGVNPETNLIYVANGFAGSISVIMDEEGGIPIPPVTPKPTPTPPDNGKSFTFNCNRNFIEGPVFGLEKLVLELGENEDCTLKLTNLETGTPVEISTKLRTGFRSSIKCNPISGVTDANGELEFTISAIGNGVDWIAWALPNENGEFEFSKKTYDSGLSWGMFVKVK